MPADIEQAVQLGAAGLNLRDSPLEVGVTGLTDTLNWRLDELGALVKRLGSTVFPSGFTVSNANQHVLEMSTYRPSSGANALLVALTDGKVYLTTGGSFGAGIATGLDTVARPSFAQLLDKIYWSKGVNSVQQWDGSTLTAITGINDVQTITITGTPTGGGTVASFGGASTAQLPFNATAAQVQTALQSLTSIGPANISCSGGPWPGTGIVCTFANAMAFTAEPLFVTTDSFTGGSSPASHVAHTTTGRGDAPKGKYLAVWRNRLFVAGVAANPNRIYWSNIGDPTAWNTLNFVDILGPRGDQITGLHASPNTGTSTAEFDGSDGILVFKTTSTHRIVDDTDNTPVNSGLGGANVLVDSATGTVSNRTIKTLNGRVYCVAKNGIYSTDGHSPLVLESDQLGALFSNQLTPTAVGQICAETFHGSYLVALAPTGQTLNSILLELYSTLGRTGGHPIMALGVPVDALAVWPDAAIGDELTFAHATTPAAATKVVLCTLFRGGGDIVPSVPSAPTQPISAVAHSGVTLFGVDKVKRLRRVRMVSRGTITVGAVTDFSTGQGDQEIFTVPSSGTPPLWNQNNWNQQNWAGSGDSGVGLITEYFGTRGRWFSFYVAETSTAVGQTSGALGIAPAQEGGAVLHQMLCTLTPLAGDV
jgi:hypothetical protein